MRDTVLVQLTIRQANWLQDRAQELSKSRGKRISRPEIIRELIEAEIKSPRS
jgi:predicted DNA-binding protein